MSVTFVTAFVSPKTAYRSRDAYIQNFTVLANTGLPIYLFLEEPIAEIPAFPNVTVQYATLDRSWLPENPVLPANRNPNKDTLEYFCIQAWKMKCMAEASQRVDTPYIAWVDFGIVHMLRNTDLAFDSLRKIALQAYPRDDKIYTPSCWSHSGPDIWNSVAWRFCGSFFLGHRSLFPEAYRRQSEIIRENLPKVTWEVNYWTCMEDMFLFYPADHNERLFTELCDYVRP
jgi:hypothetical protein